MLLIRCWLDSWSQPKFIPKGQGLGLDKDVKTKNGWLCLSSAQGFGGRSPGVVWCSVAFLSIFSFSPQHAWKDPSIYPSLYRSVDFLLPLLNLLWLCLLNAEEIASENSDSIYSSTPEVKAWAASDVCRRCHAVDGLNKQRPASAFSYSACGKGDRLLGHGLLQCTNHYSVACEGTGWACGAGRRSLFT